MAKNMEGTVSEFYCTKCGQRGIPIMRRPGQQREPGHLKKLFCLNCGEEVNHVEIRPYGGYRYEDFEEEFRLGRFVDGNRIPVANLMKCSKGDCDYNKDGRCWNSNYSYPCPHRIDDPTKHLLNRGW